MTIFTKTYYLVKVVGIDVYFPRKDFLDGPPIASLGFLMSGDIGKSWYSKESYAKAAITNLKKDWSYYKHHDFEIVPLTVKIEIND